MQCGAFLPLVEGRRQWKCSHESECEWEEMGLQLLLHYTVGGSNWRPRLLFVNQNFLEECQNRRSFSVYQELFTCLQSEIVPPRLLHKSQNHLGWKRLLRSLSLTFNLVLLGCELAACQLLHEYSHAGFYLRVNVKQLFLLHW